MMAVHAGRVGVREAGRTELPHESECGRVGQLGERLGQAAGGRGKVVVADDDMFVREGVSSLLRESGFEVVGEAGDAAQLLELVGEQRPDLAVIDIRMPPTHRTEGLVAAHQIRAEFPDIGILLLSAHVEVKDAMNLLASCERVGYLLKSRITDVNEFIETLDRIMKGGSVIDPSLVMELLGARRREDPLAALSDREREVLASMAEGRSNNGIARALWVTETTVQKHVQHILTKLQLPPSSDDHRRVLAVLTWLRAR
ncbi:MAG TPA: response regulator transcription factor [Pseudonocardia sp.]|jgi:serine/threonine-protein kinase PknK